jgi:uncharacterized protein (TIGR03067 family)
MLRVFTVLAGACLVAVSLADEKQSASKQPLEGDWQLQSVEINTQALPEDKLQSGRLVVRGERYSLTLDQSRVEMTLKLLAGTRPSAMDLTVAEGEDKGKTFHAIYKLEGNTLTVCRSIHPDQPRPSEFGTKPDTGLMLVVWKRIPAK